MQYSLKQILTTFALFALTTTATAHQNIEINPDDAIAILGAERCPEDTTSYNFWVHRGNKGFAIDGLITEKIGADTDIATSLPAGTFVKVDTHSFVFVPTAVASIETLRRNKNYAIESTTNSSIMFMDATHEV